MDGQTAGHEIAIGHIGENHVGYIMPVLLQVVEMMSVVVVGYLLRQAIAEGRLLLTCDRKLMEHRRAPGHVILLSCGSLEESVQELTQQLHIEWQHKPFTRCLLCNSLLRDATPEQLQSTPASIHDRELPAFYCPKCNQVFWEGSHVKRMRQQLGTWQNTLK